MKVLAMEVSKGKSLIVLYDDKIFIHEQEIDHNPEGFGGLKILLTYKTTGIYSRQIEIFLNK